VCVFSFFPFSLPFRPPEPLLLVDSQLTTLLLTVYSEFGHISETLRGVVVASASFSLSSFCELTDPTFHAVILIPSALTGIVAGSVSNTLSRKRTIALGCFIFAVGQAVSAVTFRYVGVLILGRIIAGSGEGLFLGTLSTYVSEIVRRFPLLLSVCFFLRAHTDNLSSCSPPNTLVVSCSLSPSAVSVSVSRAGSSSHTDQPLFNRRGSSVSPAFLVLALNISRS
jgi:MFS family permease